MVYDNDKSGWVAFDQSEVQFETTAKAKRGESVRRHRPTLSSNNSTDSWMNKPINSDSSWLPVAPPPLRSNDKDTRSQRERRRPPTTLTVQEPLISMRHLKRSNSSSNPASSSDSSASSKERNDGSTALLVSPPISNSSDRGRTRGKQPAPPVTTTPVHGGSRGRSSSRTRSSNLTTSNGRRSVSQQRRNSSKSNTGRGRSSSRTRTQTGTTSSQNRKRSSSRHNQRSRSTSRNPSTRNQRRTRSTSRTPTGGEQQRSRSSSRPRISRQNSAGSVPLRQDQAMNNSSRSRNRGGPPPSTARTRRELRLSSASSVGPGLPPRHSPSMRSGDDGSCHTADPNLGRSISFGNALAAHPPSPSLSRSSSKSKSKRGALMEKLFGNQVERVVPTTDGNSSIPSIKKDDCIHPRILLTATVYHNMATNLWITTINTNQKGVAKNPTTASKYLKAFSFASEREARESAIANAPPKMLPFSEHPGCFLCEGKFAVFRRAGHCRNCGVCICNTCSTHWPAKMIPDTYNLKKESTVKICKSCDALSKAFKKSLLTGNYEDAIALYGTGNINLRTPFPSSSKKEEIMYPIHCAVEGGNVNIVRWLMDDHFCPIKLIRTGSGKRMKRGMAGNDVPILTSKGRSVLTIAMGGLKIDILRYLVIDCDVSVYEAKDLKSSLRALEAALQALPPPSLPPRQEAPAPARWDNQSFVDDGSLTSSLGDDDESLPQDASIANKSKSSKRSTTTSRNGEAVGF